MSVSDSLSTASEPSDPAQCQQESWEDWEENESEGFKSLFTDARFATLEEVLRHDEQTNGFNLRQYRTEHGLDQVDTIRLINFIRSCVAMGRDAVAELGGGDEAWRDDAHLQPVLADDELLFHDWEEGWDKQQGGQEGDVAREAATVRQPAVTGAAQEVGSAPAPAQQAPGSSAAGHEVARLRAENEALRGVLEAMRAVVLQDAGMRDLVAEQAQQGGAVAAAAVDGPSGGAAAATPPQQQQARAASDSAATGCVEAALRIDESYFDSYSTFDIHRDMLADKVRTQAYRAALEQNPALVRGARVLDVGCGTAILSMFAARGGATAVVGIDGSEQIARFGAANVEANGLSASQGGPVTILSSKVEQLAALPHLPPSTQQSQQQRPGSEAGEQQQAGDKAFVVQQQQWQQVDVLVSEWMGYALLFESMLSSVLHARDKWLRPGGAVLPDVARLHLAAAGEGASGLDFWRDVYGFSMEAVRASLAADALKRAVVRAVDPRHLLSEAVCVHSLDLAVMREEEQDFTAPFTLTPSAGPQQVHSLVLWFDTLFTTRFCPQHPVELSTSPYGPQTHWAQTVLLLKQPLVWAPPAVALGAPGTVVAISGQLSMCRSRQTHRSLDIVLRYTPQYSDGSAGEEYVVLYGMGVEA